MEAKSSQRRKQNSKTNNAGFIRLSPKQIGERRQKVLSEIQQHIMQSMPCLLPSRARNMNKKKNQPCVSVISAGLKFIEALEESIANSLRNSNIALEIHPSVSFYTDALREIAKPSLHIDNSAASVEYRTHQPGVETFHVFDGDVTTPIHRVPTSSDVNKHFYSDDRDKQNDAEIEQNLALHFSKEIADVSDVAETVEVSTDADTIPMYEGDGVRTDDVSQCGPGDVYFTYPDNVPPKSSMQQDEDDSWQSSVDTSSTGELSSPVVDSRMHHVTGTVDDAAALVNAWCAFVSSSDCCLQPGQEHVIPPPACTDLSFALDGSCRLVNQNLAILADTAAAATAAHAAEDIASSSNKNMGSAIEGDSPSVSHLATNVDGCMDALFPSPAVVTTPQFSNEYAIATLGSCELFTSTPKLPDHCGTPQYTDGNTRSKVYSVGGGGCTERMNKGASLLLSPVSCLADGPSQLFCSSFLNSSADDNTTGAHVAGAAAAQGPGANRFSLLREASHEPRAGYTNGDGSLHSEQRTTSD